MVLKKIFLNDEEQAILDELKGRSKSEKIEILEQSIVDEDEPNNQRTLRVLLLKLKGA